MEKLICSVCGRELEPNEAYEFEDEIFCINCLDEETIVCECCGDRVHRDAGYSNDNEFVFINKNGRIKSINIDRYLERKCKQAGIERKTIHDIRRTVNSVLRGVGATAIIAASIMGHTVEVNEEFYTYDISELSTKRKLLEQVAQSITAKAV